MSFSYEESSFATPDGINIFTNSWLPDADPKAVVIIVHGHAEHVGRYSHIAEYLVEQGYVVYGLDHRGHGRSSGTRIHFKTINQPISDLQQYVDQIREQHPEKKIFIYAHSMGTVVALSFALRHRDLLAGMIVSGTAIHAHMRVSPMVISAGRIASKIIPKARLIKVAESASALTSDEAEVDAMRNDPLVERGKMRIGMAACLIDTGIAIAKRATELNIPILILHGEEDRVTPLSGGQHLYNQASSADKTLKIYPEMRHEPHNEVGKAVVLGDMVNWLNARV